jgi:AcrR family transcriptional regulator
MFKSKKKSKNITFIDDETENRIVDLAQSKFLEYGFSRITMDEIANELGISKRTLYEYFPSKKNLLNTVTDRKLMKIQSSFDTIVQDNLNVVEKIQSVFKLLSKEIGEFSNEYLEDLQKYAPDVWKKIDEFRTKTGIANLKKIIKKGQAQGIIRKDINKTIFIYIVLSIARGVMVPEIFVNSPFSMKDVIGNIIKIIWEGLFTEKGRKKYILSERKK